mgnify:CR=1 FL=1
MYSTYIQQDREGEKAGEICTCVSEVHMHLLYIASMHIASMHISQRNHMQCTSTLCGRYGEYSTSSGGGSSSSTILCSAVQYSTVRCVALHKDGASPPVHRRRRPLFFFVPSPVRVLVWCFLFLFVVRPCLTRS